MNEGAESPLVGERKARYVGRGSEEVPIKVGGTEELLKMASS